MTQLALYNQALLILGERTLSALTEENEFRRALDIAWDSGAIVNRWLEQGLWNFSIRTTQQEYQAGVEPDFGYLRAFTKPSDWVRTAMVCEDEYFNSPLTRYEDEQGFIFADLDTIFLSYVSNDSAYGNDMSLWPSTFTRFCEYDLAVRIMKRATGLSLEERDEIKKDHRRALIDARSKDAMNEPARFPPRGSWSRSRQGRTSIAPNRSRWY